MGLTFTKEDYVNKIKNDIVLRNTQVIKQVYDSTTIVTNTLINKVKNEVESTTVVGNINDIDGLVMDGSSTLNIIQNATLTKTVDSLITMISDSKTQNQILSTAKQGVSNLLASDVAFKNDMSILKVVDEKKHVSGEFNNVVDGLVTVGSKMVENMVPHAGISMKSYKNETINNYLTENNLNQTNENILKSIFNTSITNETLNKCKSEDTVTNLNKLRHIKMSGQAQLNITQNVALDMVFKCVISNAIKNDTINSSTNQVLQDIATETKSTARVDNKQGITDITKKSTTMSSYLDSLMNNIIYVIVALVLLGVGGYFFKKYILDKKKPGKPTGALGDTSTDTNLSLTNTPVINPPVTNVSQPGVSQLGVSQPGVSQPGVSQLGGYF